MTELIRELNNLDTELFLFLNSLNNYYLDVIMYYASERLTWLPLYAFLFYFLVKEYGKRSVLMILLVVVLIILSDQLSNILKDFFQRPRPCHNIMLKDWVHLVQGKCGGKFGFVSSHAANSFALASYIIFIRGKIINWLSLIMIMYALIVSYSRIYLSAHYPGDVLGGAILGFLCAWFIWILFCRTENYLVKQNFIKYP